MLIAQKPCSFAGQNFKIGETIPDGLVQPQAIGRLIKSGRIAEAGDAGQLLPASTSIEKTVGVPILADEGEVILDMSIEDLLAGVRAVQLSDEELIEEIKTIKSEEILIFIDVFRGDVTAIHEEAESKAKAIASEDILSKLPNTEDGLMRLNRDQLAEAAEMLGMEVTEEHTKRMLTAFILEAGK